MALTLDQIQDFKGKYPKQIWVLFLTEMWERFCFYGMRGVLTIFMVNRLMMSESDANLKYGAIQAFVYTFTFIGGFFADKILGFRKSIYWGGLLMIIGSLIVAFNPDEWFYFGTCFTILGTGFFKPNISTMVGELYKDGDSRRDAGFGLFYSGINIGALLGGYFCTDIGIEYGYEYTFYIAAAAIALGLVVFTLSKHTLGPIGISPIQDQKLFANVGKKEGLVYLLSLLSIPFILLLISNTSYTNMFMYTVGPLALMYIISQMMKYSAEERNKLIAALVFIFFSVVFWAFFEQSGGSLNLFAQNNLNDQLLGMTIKPNVVNNTSNSLFIILFSPLIGLLWIYLANKNREPNAVIKFGLGFLFLGLAFYTFSALKNYADANGITSLNGFTLAYLIITFGELCLSPIGLSLMTKLSPKPMWGMMMGSWFLASAYGQYVAGLLGAGMTSPNENATAVEKLVSYTAGYQQLAIYAIVAGVLLLLLNPMMKKLIGNTKT